MITSLLSIYKLDGWLPDCRMQLCKGFSQGGSNADNVIADAYVKKLPGVDWDLAYKAVKNDGENEPFDWGVEGRGGLQSWKQYGYIPVFDYDYLGFGPDFHSISRTLEYAYNDFSISQLAKGLGHEADYETYLARSANWRNLWLANQTSSINGTDTAFTGFFQPRYANGTWRYQDPIECSPLDSFCSYSSNPKETFEDSIWEYVSIIDVTVVLSAVPLFQRPQNSAAAPNTSTNLFSSLRCFSSRRTLRDSYAQSGAKRSSYRA